MRLRAAALGLGWCLILGCGARTADDSSEHEAPELSSNDDTGDAIPPSETSSTDHSSETESAATLDPDPPVRPPVSLAAPMNHRATVEACDDARPPGTVGEGYGDGVPCKSDADCTEGINGRCVDRRGPSCTYDECFLDAECTTGGPCACEGGFWSDYNMCLAGNCQVDDDCGEGGYCSPSFGPCGAYSGVVAYYCRTKEDACVEDAECTNVERGPGYCAFFPEVGIWQCGYGQCVG